MIIIFQKDTGIPFSGDREFSEIFRFLALSPGLSQPVSVPDDILIDCSLSVTVGGLWVTPDSPFA